MARPSEADILGMQTAYEYALQGAKEGGIPIGAALFLSDLAAEAGQKARKLGGGRNERIQKGSPTLHAEISALESAGRQAANVYRKCTMYTTLSPCSMCSGAILLYGIPRVVIGENKNLVGEEDLLRSRGVEVIVLNDKRCEELMRNFIQEHPEEWNEDIGKTAEQQDDST
ncbi:cytidine deaminase-like protein [Cytidiella melzeri]|nr:cytidine deaminase-like protein [Cytidiella melzeri]